MLTLASYLAESARPFYERLAAHLAARLGEPVELLARVGWEERLRRLDTGRVDVGFLCGWPYVQRADRADPPVELLCAPVMAPPRYRRQPHYFTDIVVRDDRGLAAFADLRGRAYAFNDLGSHSGYNVPRDHLLGLGETWGYFGRVIASGSHQASIGLVETGAVDAAGIDSTVLDLERARRPELSSRLRVVASLGPSPIPPVVVARRLAPARKARLREAFLALHDDPGGPVVLAVGLVQRFVPVEDADYDPIRAMARRAERARFEAPR